MTFELAVIIFGVFLYFVMAGGVSAKLEWELDFPLGLAVLFGLGWPLAIPFFVGIEIAAYILEPPQGGAGA